MPQHTSIVRVIERSNLIDNARHIFSYGSGRRHTQNAARHEDVHARHDGRNRDTHQLQDHGCPTSPLGRGVKHTLTYNSAAGAPRIKVMSGSFRRQRVSTSSRWPGMPTLNFCSPGTLMKPGKSPRSGSAISLVSIGAKL